jgi:hypothetical protein
MNRIFIGFDSRQAIGCNVLISSLYRRASTPLSITPLNLATLPMPRKGLTEFTWTRFLVPWLCDFEGSALFLDSDILAVDDIAKLFRLADPQYAVQVVNTKFAFERAAVMLFNCAHPDNAKLSPDFIAKTPVALHHIGWTEAIGWLPARWGFLAGYDDATRDIGLIHYTQGLPVWDKTEDCPYKDDWFYAHEAMNNVSVKWDELMGNSVHAINLNGELVPKYRVNAH